MAYCSASDVAALTRGILAEESAFSEDTNPTLNMVNFWLTSGCAVIEATLSGWRYATPVPAGTAVYGMVSQLNALYAAAYAEMSRSQGTLQLGEKTRGQVFLEQFKTALAGLKDIDLTMCGMSRASNGATLFVGGLTQTSKDTMSDGMLAPRFARGQYRYSGVLSPASETSASADNSNDY